MATCWDGGTVFLRGVSSELIRLASIGMTLHVLICKFTVAR